jgi:hypothetical protein
MKKELILSLLVPGSTSDTLVFTQNTYLVQLSHH